MEEKILTLKGYHLSEKVYGSKKSVVYRGVRESDKLPVMVKSLKAKRPTREELDLFEIEKARLLASKPPAGYQRLKRYLRQGVAERMRSLDESHFDELVEQWFAEDTQKKLVAAVEQLTKPKKAAI